MKLHIERRSAVLTLTAGLTVFGGLNSRSDEDAAVRETREEMSPARMEAPLCEEPTTTTLRCDEEPTTRPPARYPHDGALPW